MSTAASPTPRGAPADPWPAGLRAVLFDLDGTLVDSLPGIADTANRLLADHGRGPLEPAAVARMVGDGAALLVRRAFEATGPVPDAETLKRETARYVELLADAPLTPADLYPGATDLVASVTAGGRAAGLVTNKPAGPTAHALACLGLDGAFGAVVCGDGPAGRKPAAGPIRSALATLGVAAEAAVMIGDNAADVGAARATGVAVVAVDGGYTRIPAAALHADAVVARLADVPAAVADLWARTGA